MDLKELKKALGVDAIYGIDAETYWADSYTLSSLATTEYVTDPRFELQMMAVQKDSWAKPRVMLPEKWCEWVTTVDWSRAAVLMHHAQFDGLICSHHYGVKPKFYLDTLSMARPLMPVEVGGSLNKVARAFGLAGKTLAQALVNTKGKHLEDFSKQELKDMMAYNGDDIVLTWGIFRKMLPYFPLHELKLIDLTIKMYCQPVLLLDRAAIVQTMEQVTQRKTDMLKELKVKKTDLTSKAKFAELLRQAGCEPPSKVSLKLSEKAGEEIEVLAMSKQDQEFVDLLGHPIKRVSQLVEARFAISSNQLENRCALLASRAPLGAQPVYLNYYGAKTGRWSGGDDANWQNLSSKRKEGGQELRASVHAPPGHTLVIADLSQIEARINAWFAGQRNIVEAFRAYDRGEGPDIYRYTAAESICHKPIELITDLERFLGKSCVLALGFQAGWLRFAKMLRVGAIGPAIDISDEEAQTIHSAWRTGNPFIVANWKATNNKVKQAFGAKCVYEDGVVTYEGAGKTGWMHLPGGMAIRYDDLDWDEEGGITYMKKYRANKVAAPTIERTRLYGGILVENRTQALARCVIAEHMVAISETVENVRIAMSTHDEIVSVVPENRAEEALAAITRIMSTPPHWAPDLPLAVDSHISPRYDK